jgi:hypothetical protein
MVGRRQRERDKELGTRYTFPEHDPQ